MTVATGRVRRAGLSAAVAMAWTIGGGGAAFAAASREEVRLTLLDYCVMTEWTRRSDTSKVADECRCAAAKAAGALSAAAVKAFDKELSGRDEKAWIDATRTCFKAR